MSLEIISSKLTPVVAQLWLQPRPVPVLHLLFLCSPPAFQGCTAADDKTAAVEDFLRYLYGAMARDAIWQYASEDQLQDAQMAIERSVMNRIFKLAFYPNQDGDILRDQWVAGMTPVLHGLTRQHSVLFQLFHEELKPR